MTIRFQPAFAHKELAMAQPGGEVERPLEKMYHPTYWSMQSFAHAFSNSELPGFASFAPQPTAAASLEGEATDPRLTRALFQITLGIEIHNFFLG